MSEKQSPKPVHGGRVPRRQPADQRGYAPPPRQPIQRPGTDNPSGKAPKK
jgi:hypothetical protein